MAQKRFWNFRDDDSTNDLSNWTRGFFPYGPYMGFDADLTVAGLNLNLLHTSSGMDYVDINLILQANIGVILTKQGVMVQEDASVILPINANANANPRIDLVVLEHDYQTVIGGTQAVYVVIQGTPGVTPAVPALTDPNRQTEVGQLYIPGLTSDLSTVGVIWTRNNISVFANDPTIMRTNLVQTSTKSKTFSHVKGIAQPATIPLGILTLPATLSNFYTLAFSSTAYKTVTNVSGDTAGAANFFYLVTSQRITLESVGNGGNFVTPTDDNMMVERGEIIGFINVNGLLGFSAKWAVFTGGSTFKAVSNKFYKTISENKLGSIIDINGSAGAVTLSDGGNIIDIEDSIGSTAIKSFQSLTHLEQGGIPNEELLEAGTRFLIRNAGGQPITLKHNFVSGLPSGNKPVFMAHGADIVIEIGAIVELYEDNNFFRLYNYISASTGPFNQHLDDNIDVTLTSPTNGNVLFFNGSLWVNVSLEAKITGIVHLFTKIQKWGYDDVLTGAFDATNHAIVLPDTGNGFLVDMPATPSVKDIYVTAGTQPEAGTRVIIRAGNIGGLGFNIFDWTTGNFEQYDEVSSPNADIVIREGDVFEFLMGDAGKWILVSAIGYTMAYIKILRDDMTAVQGDITTLFSDKADKAVEPWKVVGTGGNPAFKTGWAHTFGSTAGQRPVSFRKNTMGLVSLAGSASVTSLSNLVIYTLPSGYRPTSLKSFAVPYGDGTDVVVAVLVDTTGDVTMGNGSASGSFRVDLSGIQFYVD